MLQGYRKIPGIFWLRDGVEGPLQSKQTSGRAMAGFHQDTQVPQELGRQQAYGPHDHRIVPDRKCPVLVFEHDILRLNFHGLRFQQYPQPAALLGLLQARLVTNLDAIERRARTTP